MRSDLILVTWEQLRSEWVVGKRVSIINSYKEGRRGCLLFHEGICSRIRIWGYQDHLIDIYVRNAYGIVRSMNIEQWLYNEPEHYIMVYIAPEDMDAVELSNAGSVTCWKCACPTELRRDFSNFSIREFCPRCKI